MARTRGLTLAGSKRHGQCTRRTERNKFSTIYLFRLPSSIRGAISTFHQLKISFQDLDNRQARASPLRVADPVTKKQAIYSLQQPDTCFDEIMPLASIPIAPQCSDHDPTLWCPPLSPVLARPK